MSEPIDREPGKNGCYSFDTTGHHGGGNDNTSPSACSVPPCDKCGKVQAELGGIEYGPPRTFAGVDGMWCRKLHVCVKCTAAPNG